MVPIFPGSNPGSPVSAACAGVAPKRLCGRGVKSESEGVLTMFEYFQLIVFQLAERIAIVKKSLKEVLMCGAYMLGFSYPALRTRHEVP